MSAVQIHSSTPMCADQNEIGNSTIQIRKKAASRMAQNRPDLAAARGRSRGSAGLAPAS